jgi:hypothetical protein
MDVNEDKIYEGGYTYFRDGQKYSEENFEVYRDDSVMQHHRFKAEVITRVKTGELLKVNTMYLTNKNFEPLEVEIIKTLGPNAVTERYKYNTTDKLLNYHFEKNGERDHFEKIISTRFAIATPAFSTNMIMLETKKLDPVHKTEYLVITTDNIWDYQGPFKEKRIFVEQKDREVEFKIDKKPLSATLCHVFDEKEVNNSEPKSVDYYISKHLSLPYKMSVENITIQINYLRDLTGHYRQKF